MNEDYERFPEIVKRLRHGELVIYRKRSKLTAIIRVNDEADDLLYGNGETVLAALERLESLFSGKENKHEPSR